MLDMTKIEDRSLKLDKEKFDLVENIQHVINDFGNESSNNKIHDTTIVLVRHIKWTS
jgi:flagellar basal body P-ring protein FlgI